MTYLIWQKKNITNFSQENITSLYEQGYLFARTSLGDMYQTRSLRIILKKFTPNSENRRILRKTNDLKISVLPAPYPNYHWSIHKLGKDFYSTKFGDKTFSANKIKEIMTDENKSNFNTVFNYEYENKIIGYCISYQNKEMLHYAYPFYDLNTNNQNIGLGMMIKAIMYAQEKGYKYFYLGSVANQKSLYKLQFKGLEWFDQTQGWQEDLKKLKEVIRDNYEI